MVSAVAAQYKHATKPLPALLDSDETFGSPIGLSSILIKSARASRFHKKPTANSGGGLKILGLLDFFVPYRLAVQASRSARIWPQFLESPQHRLCRVIGNLIWTLVRDANTAQSIRSQGDPRKQKFLLQNCYDFDAVSDPSFYDRIFGLPLAVVRRSNARLFEWRRNFLAAERCVGVPP